MPKRVGVTSGVRVTKMTVSIPKHLVDFADELAIERNTSRSKVVSGCLEDLEKKRKQARMEEGYRALAKEHVDFARMSAGIAHEVLPEGD
jgi:metal-responsive CopG/Arc/MetJ family transcriptional regulator